MYFSKIVPVACICSFRAVIAPLSGFKPALTLSLQALGRKNHSCARKISPHGEEKPFPENKSNHESMCNASNQLQCLLLPLTYCWPTHHRGKPIESEIGKNPLLTVKSGSAGTKGKNCEQIM